MSDNQDSMPVTSGNPTKTSSRGKKLNPKVGEPVSVVADKKKPKRWVLEEEKTICDYINENFTRYKSSARMDFLRKMKRDLNLECDDTQLKNKVELLVKKYKEMKERCGKTGEGLTEDTVEYKSWEGYVRSQCHFYFILDEVMGTRSNIEPPFEISSSSPVDTFQLNSEVIDFDRPEDVYDLGENTEESHLTTEVSPSQKITGLKRKYQKGSSSVIGEALKAQAEVTAEHYKRDDEFKSKELELHNRRFEFEQEQGKRRLILEERKADQVYELEKLKLSREKEKEEAEITKLKLQIELQKLQNNV